MMCAVMDDGVDAQRLMYLRSCWISQVLAVHKVDCSILQMDLPTTATLCH